ncbi:hypothetical protein AVEN_94951-1 [Araneus ventricosus]|uniref:Uncharacterized protein n=1 Tax=Araneus ventricosus TaxID=182803 RepID=A0A4Y2DKF6_ARAVE|nr:hypothetical protein AVEN_94951-1 [Araneus ventricosus]
MKYQQVDSIGSTDPERGRPKTLGLHRRGQITSQQNDLPTLLNLSTENPGERNKKRQTPSPRGKKERLERTCFSDFDLRVEAIFFWWEFVNLTS